MFCAWMTCTVNKIKPPVVNNFAKCSSLIFVIISAIDTVINLQWSINLDSCLKACCKTPEIHAVKKSTCWQNWLMQAECMHAIVSAAQKTSENMVSLEQLQGKLQSKKWYYKEGLKLLLNSLPKIQMCLKYRKAVNNISRYASHC